MEHSSDLDRFWNSIPALLEQQGEDWALREVLESGVSGYTMNDDTPEDMMIRHDPDGARFLVKIDLDGPDIIIRRL